MAQPLILVVWTSIKYPYVYETCTLKGPALRVYSPRYGSPLSIYFGEKEAIDLLTKHYPKHVFLDEVEFQIESYSPGKAYSGHEVSTGASINILSSSLSGSSPAPFGDFDKLKKKCTSFFGLID